MRNVEKIKMHILCSATYFWQSCHFWDMAHALCLLDT